MNLNDDMMLREFSNQNKPSRFLPKLFLGFLLLAAFLFLLEKSGNLPHYTLIIDGNKWEWVRDDAKYLASKPLDEVDLHNQQVIANNKAELERLQAGDRHQSEPQAIEQTTQTGVVVKCLTSAGRVVYQEQACESTGLKPVKVLSELELKGSRSDSQNTQILHQVTENNYQPAVASINPNGKQDSEYCRGIESQRENIRSQQRINSRQWHRDEYTRLSKLWQSECLG